MLPKISSLVKKEIIMQKLLKLKRNLPIKIMIYIYITTPEFNKFTVDVFAARLVQANLIKKTDCDYKLISYNKKINLNKTKHALVENELKNYNHLIQFILEAKVILKKMVHKIIQYFSQCTDVLKRFLVLVVVIIFSFGNRNDCLMKILHLLLYLNQLTPKLSYFGIRTRVEFNGSYLKQNEIVNIYNSKYIHCL